MKKLLLPILLMLTLVLVACETNPGLEVIPASSLVVTPETITVNVDKFIEIDVLVLPTDTTNKTLEWVIEDQSVATITNEGILTGVKVGETTLTIRVKATPAVSKNIEVSVVEEYWPNDEIEEHFGFTLPKFPTYSSLVLNHLDNDVLEFVLSGYGNDEEAITEYELLLVADGWVAGLNNDSHFGTYTKEGVNATISYHNSTSHGVETIEYKITPKTPATETNWPNTILEAQFGWTLPDFSDYKTLNVVVDDNNGLVTITLNDIKDLAESLATFTTNMESAGWIAGDNNGLDGGDFSKEGANGNILYTNTETFVITIFPKTQINLTWNDLKLRASTKFELDFPNFENAKNVSYHETINEIIGSFTSTNRHVELEAFLELLLADDWIPKEGSNHHLGTYTKGDFEFFYHENHHDDNLVEFSLTNISELS